MRRLSWILGKRRGRLSNGGCGGVNRKVVWGGGTVTLVVAVLAVAFGGGSGGAGRAGRGRFTTAKVDRGRIVARVTASGTLSALVTVQVGSQVSGRIQTLAVDFNSPVRRGQILATIDTQLFEAAVEQARANLSAADGNLIRAKAQAVDSNLQYKRAKALLESDHLVAQSDVDTAEANARAADAQIQVMQGAVEQARAALHQAQVNLGYTRIVSPIEGMVISRSVDVGQTVAASLQSPTLFTIAEDLRRMQVDTDVAEADVGKLRSGMETTFTVDAYPGDRFKGVVRQIRNAATTVQNVVTYDAVIDVQNPDLKLRPGMTANVTFIYAQKDDVLRVPNAALRFRPPPELAPPTLAKAAPDRRTVWVLRGGRPAPVTIQTGISDGSLTEAIGADLAAGEALITEAISSGGPQGGLPPALRRSL
jgi:HlyD family secretion protein